MPSRAAARPPPGEKKTVAYIIEQMKAAGLQPGGDLKDGKRAWTQAVPLLRAEIVGTPTLCRSSVDGKTEALTQGEQIAVRAPMDGSTRSTSRTRRWSSSATASRRRSATGTTSRAWTCKGKIAVVLVNDPDFETGKGDFGGKAMTYYGRWTYKYEEAARQGALGLLIVHETAPASYGWATVKNSNTNTMFDIVRDDPAGAHRRWKAGSSAISRWSCSSTPGSISKR